MSHPELDDWYSEEETARRLGVSTRTLRRKPDHEPPERQYRPRSGRRPEACYRPSDVESIEAARRGVVIQPRPPIEQQPDSASAQPRNIPAELPEFLAVIAAAVRRGPVVLTLCQAADDSGFTQSFLRRAIDAGKLPAIRDGRRLWVVRSDLDNLASVSRLSKSTPSQETTWQSNRAQSNQLNAPEPNRPAKEEEENSSSSPAPAVSQSQAAQAGPTTDQHSNSPYPRVH